MKRQFKCYSEPGCSPGLCIRAQSLYRRQLVTCVCVRRGESIFRNVLLKEVLISFEDAQRKIVSIHNQHIANAQRCLLCYLIFLLIFFFCFSFYFCYLILFSSHPEHFNFVFFHIVYFSLSLFIFVIAIDSVLVCCLLHFCG